MRICIAQTKPVRGDIQSNVENHKKLIGLAVSNGADTIIFPELSLTGYEPELAKDLATNEDDSRFDDFQKISDSERITIGVGAPTQNESGVCISLILFRPHKPRQLYSKHHLHADEEEFFISGQNIGLIGDNTNVALAICYETSVPEHSEKAFKSGAEIYLASVAMSVNGIDRALQRLAKIADKYSMTVLMSNCIGESGDGLCAGKTSIWNNQGVLLGQLNDANEGILIIDTDTQDVIEKTISDDFC